jgi:hypothetical protein
MTLDEFLEDFTNGKITIVCDTVEERNTVLQTLSQNGVRLHDGGKNYIAGTITNSEFTNCSYSVANNSTACYRTGKVAYGTTAMSYTVVMNVLKDTEYQLNPIFGSLFGG